MKARDVMSPDVITVKPDDTVDHAAALMVENGVSGLPVLAPDGVLMGIITETDIIGRLDHRMPSPVAINTGRNDALRAYIKSHGRLVADAMSSTAVTADIEAPLVEVAELLARHHIRRVIIMDGERVAGIVSRADIIRGIATERTQSEASDHDTLRRQILTQLHAVLGLPRQDTGATIRNEEVILWGTVSSEEELRAARVAAESLAGTDRVVSFMRIEPKRVGAA